MACIRERRNRLVIDFYDQHGKRRWKTLKEGTTQRDARKALREIEALKDMESRDQRGEAEIRAVSALGAKALEEYIEHLTVALLVRLVPRALPVISIVVGAHSNHEIIEHSGNTAFMVYRKRFIERKAQMPIAGLHGDNGEKRGS